MVDEKKVQRAPATSVMALVIVIFNSIFFGAVVYRLERDFVDAKDDIDGVIGRLKRDTAKRFDDFLHALDQIEAKMRQKIKRSVHGNEQVFDVGGVSIQHGFGNMEFGRMEKFCQKVIDKCVERQRINDYQDLVGTEVKRGMVGRSGVKGEQGPIGPRGLKGDKGDKGLRGLSGLDGRDGLPGEPGLDGVPGRSGIDGRPGKDGIPGSPGNPGKPGQNGQNGDKGDKGSKGDPGISGPRGLPGPIGAPGSDGKDGQRGEPGISVWATRVPQANMLPPKEDIILIPPTISGSSLNKEIKIINVVEGSHLKLTCIASGIPRPVISWSRVDEQAFPDGTWWINYARGPSLILPRVHRVNAGRYKCEANNGVPESDYQVYEVAVNFPPLITVEKPMVSGVLGQSIVLECLIDGHPEPVVEWERYDNLKLPDISSDKEKYKMHNTELGPDTMRAVLIVAITSSNDYGSYSCKAQNEEGVAEGVVTLYESVAGSAVPPPRLLNRDASNPFIFGKTPPDIVSIEELCPAPIKCDQCENYFCQANVRRDEITIVPYDPSFKSLPPREQKCLITAVGKPVLLRYNISGLFGSWMKESMEDTSHFDNKGMAEMVWETKAEYNQLLFEYPSKSEFGRSDLQSLKNYSLMMNFSGNDHVIYNGTFFYYNHPSESIVSFNLDSGESKKLTIPRNAFNEKSERIIDDLYKDQFAESYVDLAADENGVWGLFGHTENNHTIVVKIDPFSLRPQYMWDISVNHKQIIDSFIACGNVYFLEDGDNGAMKIGFAIDLYENKIIDLDLPFTNPYEQITMLSYNPKMQSLTSWNGGKPLTYPLKYKELSSI